MADLTKAEEKIVKEEVEKQLSKKEKLLEKTRHFKNQYKQHVATAIIAAFGFLIALVWKDFITKFVETFTKVNLLERYPYLADLYSLIIITTISVIGIIIVSRWAPGDPK